MSGLLSKILTQVQDPILLANKICQLKPLFLTATSLTSIHFLDTLVLSLVVLFCIFVCGINCVSITLQKSLTQWCLSKTLYTWYVFLGRTFLLFLALFKKKFRSFVFYALVYFWHFWDGFWNFSALSFFILFNDFFVCFEEWARTSHAVSWEQTKRL